MVYFIIRINFWVNLFPLKLFFKPCILLKLLNNFEECIMEGENEDLGFLTEIIIQKTHK
jgi:hypothetical protein